MTSADFVTWAQGYYGPYPAGQRVDVAEYLRGLSADDLDELKVQMRAACPSHINQVNGYPPDIEAMERLMPEVRRVVNARARERRELEYAARMLPAPEPVNSGDMMRLDWGTIFREGLRCREAAEAQHRR